MHYDNCGKKTILINDQKCEQKKKKTTSTATKKQETTFTLFTQNDQIN